MQLLSAVVALFVVGEIVATIDYQCWNFKSTDEIREKYQKTINNLRAKIAKGEQDCKESKKCPQGKNIYKLNWDCLLENQAQKVVDKCNKDEPAPKGLGMVLEQVKLETCNANPLFKKTVEGWWNVVQDATTDSTSPLLNTPELNSFATLAHGAATRVGCAQKNCNGELFMACMVYKEGPAESQPIYEVGPGCSGPQDCETYAGSKCNQGTKLCVAGYIDPTKTTTTSATTATTTTSSESTTTEPTTTSESTTTPLYPGENTMCKDQTNLSSDPIRKTFRDQHNHKRSAVAKGSVKMGSGGMCRNATKMWKLEYNCELEKSAYAAAQGCQKVNTSSTQFDEVWHVFDKAIPDMKNAAEQAVDLWYKEIESGYMNQTTGSQNMWLPQQNIPNFAKMVWDSHTEIGCAIVKCGTNMKAVCHYSPAKARYGNPIYAMGGPTCNLCTNMSATCSKVGLCKKN